jgi:MFS family permease
LTYLGEFRKSWSNLLGACIAMATGASLSFYTMSLFGPSLIEDLGWSKADFALVSTLPLLTFLFHPLIGHFIDRVGPRIAVATGFAGVIVCFLTLSLMTQLWQYLAINVLLGFSGLLTSSMALSRVIVDRFDAARGVGLALLTSASPLSGALAAPLLNPIVAEYGWRTGYLVLAAISTVGGLIAIALIGRSPVRPADMAKPPKLNRAELTQIARNPVFPVLMGAMFLVNIPGAFASSQLILVTMEQGVSRSEAVWMVSLFAMGVIGGRWICGIALDKLPAHWVAVVAFGAPVLSYAAFASGSATTPMLIAAILLIGLAQGAEGDVGAFILSRRFETRNFSLVYSILNMMVASGSAIGALVLSYMLRLSDSYHGFVVLCLFAELVGAVLWWMTGFIGREHEPTGETEAGEATVNP